MVSVRDCDHAGEGRGLRLKPQSFAEDTFQDRPAHGLDRERIRFRDLGALARAPDEFECHHRHARVCCANNLAEPLAIPGDGFFISLRRGKIAFPKCLPLALRAVDFSQQKCVDAGDHLGRKIPLESQRLSPGQPLSVLSWGGKRTHQEKQGQEHREPVHKFPFITQIRTNHTPCARYDEADFFYWHDSLRAQL